MTKRQDILNGRGVPSKRIFFLLLISIKMTILTDVFELRVFNSRNLNVLMDSDE